MILAKYRCKDCNLTFIADGTRWHMDYCPKCKKNAVDLEEYYGEELYCRMIGNIEHIEDFKSPFFEDENDYHSALLGWLNDSDEEYVIYGAWLKLIIEKISGKNDKSRR